MVVTQQLDDGVLLLMLYDTGGKVAPVLAYSSEADYFGGKLLLKGFEF